MDDMKVLQEALEELKQAKKQQQGSSDFVEPCRDLAYVIPQEGYVFRHPDGNWDNRMHAVGRPAALQWLTLRDYSLKQAKLILSNNLHIQSPGFVFRPTSSETEIDGYLNCYRLPSLMPKEGNWATISELLNLVTNFDATGRQWLLNWLAAVIQKPGVPRLGAVVLWGGTGIGKTQLGEMISYMLGPENCASIGGKDIASDFNSHFANKMWVVANEVVTNERHQEALKAYISDKTVMLNRKGVPQQEVPNHMSWWFTSNDSLPVRFSGDDDRHYLAIFHQPKHVRSFPEYKQRIEAMFSPRQPGATYSHQGLQQVAAFAWHLKQIAVDYVLANTPYDNVARSELATASKSPLEMFFKAVDESSIDGFVNRCLKERSQKPDQWDWGDKGVSTDMVYEAYQHWCKEGSMRPASKIVFHREAKHKTSWGKSRLPNRHYVFLNMPRFHLTAVPVEE